MIVNMLNDFRTFFVIMAVFWFGVCLALVFMASDTPQYANGVVRNLVRRSADIGVCL